MKYHFTIDTEKKYIKLTTEDKAWERTGGVFITPYADTYQMDNFISFSFLEKYKPPKSIEEYGNTKDFFAISIKDDVTYTLNLGGHNFEFFPDYREDPKEFWHRLLNLKKAMFGNSSSASSSPRAVFHGTRIIKLPSDNGGYDLWFQANVSVYGVKGEKIRLVAYVDGPVRGKGLYAPSSRYKTSEGNVAVGETYQSRSDSDTTWPQATLSLPFSELCLPDGNHTINVRWFAQAGGKFIGNSEFQTVHFTKRGKEITNFYVDGGEATPGY